MKHKEIIDYAKELVDGGMDRSALSDNLTESLSMMEDLNYTADELSDYIDKILDEVFNGNQTNSH